MAGLAQRTPPTRSHRDPIVIRVGVREPDLFDAITTDDGGVIDTGGATVLFSMRPLLSRTPVISSAAGYAISPADSDGNNVGYAWQSSDVAIPGEYMAWWGVVVPSELVEETPEFKIIISDHGPGLGYPVGVVVDGVSEYMPVTLDALKRDSRYGDRFLQKVADRAKRSALGSAVSADAESAYDPSLIEYLSVQTAILLIPAAREYWARQHKTVMTQGPSESAVYPDMLQALTELEPRLRAQAAQMLRELPFLVPGLVLKQISPMPATSFDGVARSTPDPSLTPLPRLGGPRTWGWW